MVGENGRNPVKKLPRPRFVHHETHMEGPRLELGTPAVGGERLTACATRPPMAHIMYLLSNIQSQNTQVIAFPKFLVLKCYFKNNINLVIF